MSAIFLSTESQSPAAQMIIDCFIEIQQNMDIVSLDKYTDAISTISIIPLYYKVVVIKAPLQGLVLHCKGCCGLVHSSYRKTVYRRLQPQPFTVLLIS